MMSFKGSMKGVLCCQKQHYKRMTILLFVTHSVESLKFLTDGMLGKLTRWLRMLGHDVKYSISLEDEELIKTAKVERRAILTCDLKLYQQAMTHALTAFLVEGSTEAEKLANLAKRFNISLEFDATVSRCPKCNSRIQPVPKKEVMSRIPKATSTYYSEFWKCSRCGQVYWHGSHWEKIEKTLREAREVLAKQ